MKFESLFHKNQQQSAYIKLCFKKIGKRTMRILNENDSHSLEKIILYLTIEEALELKDSLLDLIENPMNNHAHISSEDFKKEITLCIYDTNNLKGLNQRSIDLILNDE